MPIYGLSRDYVQKWWLMLDQGEKGVILLADLSFIITGCLGINCPT